MNADPSLSRQLKAARNAKQLSQRDLSELVDLPQSHLSKIESGSVDFRASSLTQISRALEQEVMLVPRHLVPVVKQLIRGSSQSDQPSVGPAYSLDEPDDD